MDLLDLNVALLIDREFEVRREEKGTLYCFDLDYSYDSLLTLRLLFSFVELVFEQWRWLVWVAVSLPLAVCLHLGHHQ